MREVHAQLSDWMAGIGMRVRVDAAGNLRGLADASPAGGSRLILGSHLDSVPHAGAFDGVLGVVMGIALVEQLHGTRRPYAIEVIGFSDEEGTRFGAPFIGSRALAGTVDAELLDRRDGHGRSVADAIRDFGLDPALIDREAIGPGTLGYLEIHIEQGPVLDLMNAPLAVVTAIAGQSRCQLTFTGAANHAGTTPMSARRDALAGAAEWIVAVEHEAKATPDLVATVGRLDVEPGAGNVIPGSCRVTLDVRHRDDRVRHAAHGTLLNVARAIAGRRRLDLAIEPRLDQAAVPMDHAMTSRLVRAVEQVGVGVHCMPSGAGHDAMVLAPLVPVGMLFVRSPSGVSHHPDETVRVHDVAAALDVAHAFLEDLARG
jgi:allantoate deiminase